jgi:deoxyadenosine/deoxycytidine kinase
MKVVVDGNIGAGKTTQLNMLKKLGAKVFKEPIEEWPLEEFYADPKKGIFPLQMAILMTLQPQGPGIYERSLLSSRWVFWEWAKDRGLVEFAETYENCYEKHAWSPDLYIFLSKSPEECYLHISSRNQVGDSKVTLDYLRQLDELYKKMIPKVPCKVHIIDASARPEEIHAKILNILNNNEHSEVLFSDFAREKVQESSIERRKVCIAPFPDMCRMS